MNQKAPLMQIVCYGPQGLIIAISDRLIKPIICQMPKKHSWKVSGYIEQEKAIQIFSQLSEVENVR